MKFKHQSKCLKAFRLKKGMSQGDLARYVGHTNMLISRAEKGQMGITFPLARALIELGLNQKTLFRVVAKDFKDHWHFQLKTKQKKGK